MKPDPSAPLRSRIRKLEAALKAERRERKLEVASLQHGISQTYNLLVDLKLTLGLPEGLP